MRNLMILTLLTIVFAGCKKDDNGASPDTKLRAHKWHLNAQWTNGQSVTLPECVKDDYMIFEAGSAGYQDFGTNLCSPSLGQKLNFNWNISGDQKYIVLMQNGSTVNYKIVSLDDAALEVEWLVTPNTMKYRFAAE
jgi:hypothetical protein